MSSWHAKGGAAPTKNGPNTTLPLPPPAKPEKKPSTPPLSNQNVPAPPFYNYFAMFQVHLCWRGGEGCLPWSSINTPGKALLFIEVQLTSI